MAFVIGFATHTVEIWLKQQSPLRWGPLEEAQRYHTEADAHRAVASLWLRGVTIRDLGHAGHVVRFPAARMRPRNRGQREAVGRFRPSRDETASPAPPDPAGASVVSRIPRVNTYKVLPLLANPSPRLPGAAIASAVTRKPGIRSAETAAGKIGAAAPGDVEMSDHRPPVAAMYSFNDEEVM